MKTAGRTPKRPGTLRHAAMTETSAQQSEHERLRKLIESTDDWLWEVDAELHYTWASPQIQQLLGYSPAEIIGKTPFDLMPLAEAERVREDFMRIFDAHEPFALLENINQHRNGQLVVLETSGKPFRDERGIFRGFRGIDRDITERRRHEIERWHYSQILEQMAEAALIIDPDLNISFLNKAFDALFGYPPGSLIGQPLSVLGVPGSDLLQPQQVITALREQGSWRGEVQRRKADGTALQVLLSAKATHDRQGRLLGYIGTYFDLSELKLNAERLKQSMVGTIQAIALTLEKRDPYTAGHQNRVADLCVALAQDMGRRPAFIEGLRLGALIHDIGKIQIPAEILNRPGRLSSNEMALIRSHPQNGYEIVANVDFPWPVKEMILQHHERLDGSGYPAGLKGEQILLEAQILAVADTVEAMTSHRPYRAARGLELALQELELHRGSRYNSEVVDACLRLFRKEYFGGLPD